MASKSTQVEEIFIEPLKRGRVSVKIIGTTPLYLNSMSVKAQRSLLIGGGKKTAAEKQHIKHNPEEEFNSSIYRMKDGPTFLGFPAPGVKGAMAQAALETKGVKKTNVQRLVFLPHVNVRIWGRPYLKMDVVRSADMNKTPDIRTRAYLPEWCSEIDVAFITPTLNATAIVTLLANAGLVSGIGDFRQEKGKGSFGSFSVVSDEDQKRQWGHLVKHEGRAVQEQAMANPEAADEATDELWKMLRDERARRHSEPEPKAKAKRPPKANGTAEVHAES